MALVTGGARGIGFETARQLHLRGASVAVLDLDAEQAREAAERIGERAFGIGADVTDAGAMMAAVAETVERFGGLDIAVANAGIAPEGGTARTMPPEEWERVVDVDLMGVWHTVRAALPQISERQGQLVLVASVAAFMNGSMLSPYAVAEGRGRAARAGAAHGAGAVRGERDRRLLRLDRHRDGARGARPPGRRAAHPGNLPEVVLQAPDAGRRRRRDRAASRSGRRASSRRAGGATSPPCAA